MLLKLQIVLSDSNALALIDVESPQRSEDLQQKAGNSFKIKSNPSLLKNKANSVALVDVKILALYFSFFFSRIILNNPVQNHRR